MTKIYLTRLEAKAIEDALDSDVSDPILLIKQAGFDVSKFFEFGDWRGADFRKSDLTNVSFLGADLGGAFLTKEQYHMVAKTSPSFLPTGYSSMADSEPGMDPMVDPDELISMIQEYNPECDFEQIRNAVIFGKEAHRGQFRHSDEPYFTHPFAVAQILAEQQLDDATIIVALLHDTIEDTRVTYADISEKFDEGVAALVDGVTKLNKIPFSSTGNYNSENFRKLFLSMSKDPRVILVKLADRLHNMRTIKSMRVEKQEQKARETMDIYAPLAARLGMRWMSEELEDLAFRVLNPGDRNSIIRRFITLQRETGDVVQTIVSDIRNELREAEIDAEVFGRAKKPYAIWRKMQALDVGFSSVHDIYWFRVICKSEADCYSALDVLHRRWNSAPEYFNDFIKEPKPNGFRSIVTVVSTEDVGLFEVQLCTKQMWEVAEIGVAALKSFDGGVQKENNYAAELAEWLSSAVERDWSSIDEVILGNMGLHSKTKL